MLKPFHIKGQCAASQATLHDQTRQALTRGLPVIGQADAHDGVVSLVGSGPSIHEEQFYILARGPLVAIKGAHDWLIDHGIVPNYAICADPGESQWRYFSKPRKDVTYLLASQCHPSLFDHLKDYAVKLWHSYMHGAQAVLPLGTPMIGGGTTTGMRAITLFYSMGYRTMHLYGFDGSVPEGGPVRAGLNLPTEDEDIRHEIVVGNRHFFCTPALVEQAQHFQDLFLVMPDLTLHSHGDGLIPAILDARANRPLRTVSFLHHGGPAMASYRYRCAMPAAELGANINDLTADVLIVSKPEALTIMEVKQALGRGQSVIADFCDDHFETPHYREMIRLADALTCSTEALRELILQEFKMEATVIPEPYEFPHAEPHCEGLGVLWFGSKANYEALGRFTLPWDWTKVSSADGTIPWSHDTMLKEFAKASVVIMPRTKDTKSPNRTIEAIRQGCFVIADPHPSLNDIPGIFLGDIEEGIQWAWASRTEVLRRIKESQTYILDRYAPRTVAAAWSRVIQVCPSTWGQVSAPGPIGSISTLTAAPTFAPSPTLTTA